MWVTPDAEQLIGKIVASLVLQMRITPMSKNSSAISSNTNTGARLKWRPCASRLDYTAIAPQILRHRSFSFQEFGQLCSCDRINVPDLRRQDMKNRQNSIDDLPEED